MSIERPAIRKYLLMQFGVQTQKKWELDLYTNASKYFFTAQDKKKMLLRREYI